MCSIKVSKNTFIRKNYKSYPTSFLSKLFAQKYLEIALMSTHIFYKENLPYKSRFSNRKLLHKKHPKQKWISVQKVLIHLSLLEHSWISQYLMKSANPNKDILLYFFRFCITMKFEYNFEIERGFGCVYVYGAEIRILNFKRIILYFVAQSCQ